MSEGRQQGAGAFDIRNVIAALIGIYGVVLVVVGLVGASDEQLQKTGGVNANLWAGIAMAAVGLAFALWSRLRPIVVDEAAVAEARDGQDDAGPVHPSRGPAA
jgi:uncharacterized membrane protein